MGLGEYVLNLKILKSRINRGENQFEFWHFNLFIDACFLYLYLFVACQGIINHF